MFYITLIIPVIGAMYYMAITSKETLTKPQKVYLSGLLGVLGVLSYLGLVHQYGYGLQSHGYFWIGILLLLMSIRDITTYKIPIDLIGIGYIIGGTMELLDSDGSWYWNFLWAILALLIFLGISKLLRGGIGAGDAHVLAILVLARGWQYGLVTLLAALLFSVVAGLLLMIFAGKSKKTVLPFVPFITLSYLGMIFF